MTKVISFAPNKLVRMYLDKIKTDTKAPTPSQLMTTIVSEYVLMKYGVEERNNLRQQFLSEYFDD